MSSVATRRTNRQPVPGRAAGAGAHRGDRRRPRGHRSHSGAPRRALPAQRAEPGGRGRPGDLSLVLRRRDGARPGAAGRKGAVVPQPLGAHARRSSQTLGEARRPRIDPRAGMLAIGPNTNVLTHAGRTLALVEAGVANYELTEELDTIGTCDFDGTLSGGYTGHPHRDPKTGELHAISYSFARGQHRAVLGDRYQRAGQCAPSTSR